MSKNKPRVLSFDPGLSHTGYAILDYNLNTGAVFVHKLGELEPGKISGRAIHRRDAELYTQRVITLEILEEEFKSLVDQHAPDYVVMEDAFFNRKFPSAFGALCMWQCTIRRIAKVYSGKPVYAISPKAVKAAISGDGTSGKLNVQRAILAHEDIVIRSGEKLQEHSADACAIGYTFIRQILPALLCQFPV